MKNLLLFIFTFSICVNAMDGDDGKQKARIIIQEKICDLEHTINNLPSPDLLQSKLLSIVSFEKHANIKFVNNKSILYFNKLKFSKIILYKETTFSLKSLLRLAIRMYESLDMILNLETIYSPKHRAYSMSDETESPIFEFEE